MRTTKFVAVAVVLIARICQAEIVLSTSSPDESTSSVVEDLVNIVTSCFKGRSNAVGLAGHLPDTLLRTLPVQHGVPVILMDDTKYIKNTTVILAVADRFRYKLQNFVVGVSSFGQLSSTINFGMKPSIWWNHMASFIILDQSPRCSKIAGYLFIAWQHNLLNAKVMCYNRFAGHRALFNYNPFTNQAPASWAQVHVLAGENNHPFTLFMREYLDNDEKCVDLDFVKTKNLGGHEISVDGNPENLEFTDKKYVRTSQEWARLKRILYTIYRAVNATPKFSGRTDNFRMPDTEVSMRESIVNESYVSTYPHQRFGIVIVSKFRGHKSQLEKILSVTDIDTRIGMVVVYFITLIFFKFFMHQALMTAILNLVRMTCNTGFTNLNDSTAQKLYLTGLLFFVITIQGIYQGVLASLLTNKIPYKNIDTIEDLVHGDYTIYGMFNLDYLMKTFGLEERFVQINHPNDCLKPVLDDLSAVCLYYGDGYVMDVARFNDLHLSGEFVVEFFMVFKIQRFWYFEEQINTILRRMTEADVFETWDMKCSPFTLDDFQFDKEVLKNTDYKVIELNELLFAFFILGIGLLCATITFIVELAIYRF